MQVSVESTGALQRRMKIQVPAEQVNQEVENRLQSMAKTARLDGFRPGKVPVKVVKQKFGKQVRGEVLDQVVRTNLDQALTEQQIRPAGEPVIEAPADIEGPEIEYTVTFEVYPEIELSAFDSIKVEKPVVDIQQGDIEQMLDKLCKQRTSWETVDRGAENGDKIVIDFDGTMDGESFPGGGGKRVSVELDSGMLVEGFEEQLVGASAGDDLTVDVTFPDEYHLSEIAGKPASFAVHVHSVVTPVVPELDDELAKSFGVESGGVEKLTADVRNNMGRELELAVRARLKEQAFDGLLAENDIDVPAALVSEEQKRLAREARDASEGAVDSDLTIDLYEEQARKRVKLGLLINEIVSKNGVEVDHTRVRTMVENLAASYEEPDQVIAWYYENPQNLSTVQGVVLEDQVVDWLLDQVDITEKPMGFYDLLDPNSGT